MNRNDHGSRIRGFFTQLALCLIVLGLALSPTTLLAAEDTVPDWLVQRNSLTENQLDELEHIVQQTRRMNPTTSLLVAQDGDLVVREYFRGLKPGEAVNIKSASKSILSILVGVALQNGDLNRLGLPILNYLDDSITVDDPRKRTITIHDLLLMRSGLRTTSYEDYGPWVASDNWIRYALSQPLEAQPGTVTSYSTGDSHLLAATLGEIVNQDLLSYANKNLFHPIGGKIEGWVTDPRGYRQGGNNLYVTPNTLLRFGDLMLNDGRHNGRQLVPSSWLKVAMSPHVTDTRNEHAYGYYWWVDDSADSRIVFAWGYGGQFLFLVPSNDLAVVITSRVPSKNRPPHHNQRLKGLMKNQILPIFEGEKPLPLATSDG